MSILVAIAVMAGLMALMPFLGRGFDKLVFFVWSKLIRFM